MALFDCTLDNIDGTIDGIDGIYYSCSLDEYIQFQ